MLNKKNTVVEEKNKTEEQMGLIDKGNASVMTTGTDGNANEPVDLETLLDYLKSVGIDLSDVRALEKVSPHFAYHKFFFEPVGALMCGDWLVVYRLGGTIDFTLNPRITPLMVKDASISGYINGMAVYELYISDSPVEIILKKGAAQLVTTFEDMVKAVFNTGSGQSQTTPQTEPQTDSGDVLTIYVANITRTPDSNTASLKTIDHQLPMAA